MKPGLNKDTVQYIRLQLDAAKTNVTIAYNTMDVCAINHDSITADQSESIMHQMDAIRTQLMALETQFGRRLMEQFIRHEKKYIEENR